MISLEKAKALKEAGLRWEPKRFDLFTDGTKTWEVLEVYTGEGDIRWIRGIGGWVTYGKNFTFLPRLDQLLGEIEKRGWEYACYSKWEGKYNIEVYKTDRPHNIFIRHKTDADTPEDAAAEALLWIMKEELHG